MDAGQLSVEVSRHGTAVATVRLAGDWSGAAETRVRAAYDEAARACRAVTLDLGGVESLRVGGLTTLLILHGLAGRDGNRLSVVAVPERYRHLFAFFWPSRAIHAYGDPGDARFAVQLL
jgi:ABC-type transporter Mla MlaB component